MASPHKPKTLQTMHLLAVLMVTLSSALYTNAQIITNPASYVELEQGGYALGDISCDFQRVSPSDVIGWVVDGTRISNDDELDDAAITDAFGPGFLKTFALSYSEKEGTTPQQWAYGLDIFDVPSEISGDYKCQLCADSSCTTIIDESTIAEVRVQYEPTSPPVCLAPSSDRVVLEDSVMLSCLSDPGVPVLDLQWDRGSSTTPEPGQSPAVVMDGVLYNNFTFTPVVADSGVIFKCRTSASTPLECTGSASTFTLVSVPHVVVTPPSNSIPIGGSGTYTCSATSDTKTPILTYVWNIEDIPTSRYTVNGNSVTIDDITTADHGKEVECEATDAQNMKGTGYYTILVEGEVIPSNLPTIPPTRSATATGPVDPISTTAVPSTGFPVAYIVTIVVVVVVVICLVFAVSCFCYRKRKLESKGASQPVVKNNLSPTMAAPYKSENAFAQPNVDPKKTDPDVIPKGVNERPVDAQAWWRESGAPEDSKPAITSVNMPFQTKGSKSNLDDPYNYNPAYDDKGNPEDLDVKVPFDDYSDSGIGYRDGDNVYPVDKYGKSYSDVVYNSDVGYEERNYDDREYGDGHQDPPHPQNYPYNDDYGRVYDGEYQSPPEKYSSYDAYPDRMPDGSEGYEPPPEGYEPPPEGYSDQPAQPFDGYSNFSPQGDMVDYGEPEYGAPREYGDQPNEYDSQPAAYDDHPVAYDDQPPTDYEYQPHNSDYAPPPDGYSNDQASYHAAPYEDPDQYHDSYYPDRIPDGGAPEGNDYSNYGYPAESEPYADGYGDGSVHYDNGADYASSSHPNVSYQGQPAYAESYHSTGQSHDEAYFNPEEVSATSNPSYV